MSHVHTLDATTLPLLAHFDALKLLEQFEFPGDFYERAIKRCRSKRQDALHRRLEIRRDPHGYAPNGFVDCEKLPIELTELREHLVRFAAAVIIQSLWRGWQIRKKFVQVVCYRISERALSGGTRTVFHDDGPHQSEAGTLDFAIQERLLRKYQRYCKLYEVQGLHPPVYPFFCAALIQASIRGFRTRKLYRKIKSAGGADKLSQDEQRQLQQIMQPVPKDNFIESARKIQRAWRRYYSRKVYFFYRELIKFREKGDPKRLLRFINPREAKLVDSGSGVHVRFRLGGTSFPPTIYYKIFVHSALVDMNAFSPRVYWTNDSKQPLPSTIHAKTQGQTGSPHSGWYSRIENNGWRPVSDKTWDELNDDITYTTSRRPVSYHLDKLKRREEVEIFRKKKRIQWMQKLYEQGAAGLDVDAAELTEMKLPIDAEHDNADLVLWSRALDFDDYILNWGRLATTGKSDKQLVEGDPKSAIAQKNQRLVNFVANPSQKQNVSTLPPRPFSQTAPIVS